MPSRVMRSRIAGHSSSMKRLRSPSRSRTRARGDEQADAAPDVDQAFVLESLVGLGDRQRVRLLLGGKRTNRGKGVAVTEFAGEDCVGDRLRGGGRKRAFRGSCEASCCGNTAARMCKVNLLAASISRTICARSGRGRSSSSRSGLPMKMKPAMRSPGRAKAALTIGE